MSEEVNEQQSATSTENTEVTEINTAHVVEQASSSEVDSTQPNPPETIVDKEFRYQPCDEKGHKLGGEQVIKYTNQDDLTEKLKNQNVLLIRRLREETRLRRLGIVEEDQLPESVVHSEDEYRPRVLSVDERVQLSRDILDPEKFDQATDTLFEAKLGMKPQKLQDKLSNVDRLQARMEADTFVATTPGYFRSIKNWETMTNWMVKNNLAPIRSNFDLAFKQLSEAGLLEEAPIVSEEVPKTKVPNTNVTVQTPVNSQPEQAATTRISENVPATATRTQVRTASGLTRSSASNVGTTSTPSKITVSEVEKMSSEEYKRRLKTDPPFAKTVDELYAVRR